VGFGSWEQVLDKRLVPPFNPQDTSVTTDICNKYLHLQQEAITAAVASSSLDDKKELSLSAEEQRLVQDCHYMSPQFAAAFSAPAALPQAAAQEQEHHPDYHKFTKHTLHSIDTFSRLESYDCGDY
jgi:hypothetical protein